MKCPYCGKNLMFSLTNINPFRIVLRKCPSCKKYCENASYSKQCLYAFVCGMVIALLYFEYEQSFLIKFTIVPVCVVFLVILILASSRFLEINTVKLTSKVKKYLILTVSIAFILNMLCVFLGLTVVYKIDESLGLTFTSNEMKEKLEKAVNETDSIDDLKQHSGYVMKRCWSLENQVNTIVDIAELIALEASLFFLLNIILVGSSFLMLIELRILDKISN